MKLLNSALIGCGRIAFLLENDPLRYKPCTHYGGAGAAGVKINYACDIDSNRLKKFSTLAKIPEENTFTDYRELLQKVKPNLVIIATWTSSHVDIALCALKNGTRVIICEKPIASNLTDAKKLIDACKRKRAKLIINHERRYESRYRTVKKILSEKKIGDVKTVYASILTGGYQGKSTLEEGGGPLLHDGTHMVDIIRFFFGDIKTVTGEFQRIRRKKGFEDRALAWLKTSKNIDIILEAGGNREYFAFDLQISGTRGKITIGNGYENIYYTEKSQFYTGFKDLKQQPFPNSNRINCFEQIYKEAKLLLQGKSVSITSGGIDGYKSLEIIHAIYFSSFFNGKKIELPVKPDTIDIEEIFNL